MRFYSFIICLRTTGKKYERDKSKSLYHLHLIFDEHKLIGFTISLELSQKITLNSNEDPTTTKSIVSKKNRK